MSTVFEVNIDLGLFRSAVDSAIPIALDRAAQHVKTIAVQRAPIQEGHLRGSAGVTTRGTGADTISEVKFPGPYARFQEFGPHFNPEVMHHPRGGESPYLTPTMISEGPRAIDIIADTIRQLT